MPALSDYQAEMAAFLTAAPGSPVSERLVTASAGAASTAQTRLAIYRNNVYSRLIEALEATYPAVARLTGRDFFRFAALQFALAHPSRNPSLIEYGQGFADFLEHFEPAATLTYLPDVARLEMFWLEAYHSPDVAPLTPADALSAGAEYLALHPSAKLLHSAHAASRIWEVNVGDQQIDGPIKLPPGPEHLLIVRPEATVEVRRLARGAWHYLRALNRGASRADAAAAARATDPGIDIDAHEAGLAAGGTFVATSGPTEDIDT